MSRVHAERDLGALPPSRSGHNGQWDQQPHQQHQYPQHQQQQPPIRMQPLGHHNQGYAPTEFEYNNKAQMGQENSYPEQQSVRRSQMPVTVQQQQYPQPYSQSMSGNSNSPSVMVMQPGVGYSGRGASAPHQVNSYSLANVPSGLEYLASLDRIFIRQKIELLEVLCGCETNNKYQIFDSYGHEIFYAKEDTDFCTRYCLGTIRPFDMVINDGHGQEVIHLTRPLGCGSCCFPCCLQSLDVFAPPGNFVGSIQQDWSLCIPKFQVKDAQGQTVLHIKGPCVTMSCCNDVEFNVLSLDKSVEVGKISKKWSGLTKEFFTDADNFGLSFPIDLDVKMKAVMVGACMLIDFMFFEQSGDK